MKRAAMFGAMLAAGAAQDVTYDGTPVPSWAATSAGQKAFGDGGVVDTVPSWLAQGFATYHHLSGFDGSSELSFLPQNGGLAPSRAAHALGKPADAAGSACGAGWAKNEDSDLTPLCFSDPEIGLKANNWGWSNKITQGQEFTRVPVYIGASQCTGGKNRFDIEAKFIGSTVTITLEKDGWSLRKAHVWVGDEYLPRQKNGAFTDGPGSFPEFRNVGDDPVVTFQVDPSKAQYFAVHVNACPEKDAAPTPPPPTAETPPPTVPCPSSFYVAYYHCGAAACQEAAGGLAAQLAANGWADVTPKAAGPTFTAGPSTYGHPTQVLALETSDVFTVTPNAVTTYTGAFAAGCGKTLAPPPPGPPGPPGTPGTPRSEGPVKKVCLDVCLWA